MRYRDYFKTHCGNLVWCKPYITEDGKIAYIMANGYYQDAKINGKTYSADNRDKAAYDAFCERLARALFDNECHDGGASFDDFSGYCAESLVNIDQTAHECDCSDCPWFKECEAMDEPLYCCDSDDHWAVYRLRYESPRTGKPIETTRKAESAEAAIDMLCEQYGWRAKLEQYDADTRGLEWAKCAVDPDGGINYRFAIIADWVD